MVVTFLLPTEFNGTWQERVATPSIITVQAPHWAMPQPYLVPVMPSVSRSTHKSGVRGSAFAWTDFPLTLRTAIYWVSQPRRRCPETGKPYRAGGSTTPHSRVNRPSGNAYLEYAPVVAAQELGDFGRLEARRQGRCELRQVGVARQAARAQQAELVGADADMVDAHDIDHAGDVVGVGTDI